MGRILTTERRQACIALWRERFTTAAFGTRPTVPDIIRLLELDAARLSATERDLLSEARRKLWVALALPAGAQPTALDAWLARYLVDTSPHLLLGKKQRNAVLASIRDDDRRKRERQAAVRLVNLRVPADLVGQLRYYARNKKLPDAVAAIRTLLESSQSKQRASTINAAPSVSEPDLFGLAIPEGPKAAKPASTTKPRLQKKK